MSWQKEVRSRDRRLKSELNRIVTIKGEMASTQSEEQRLVTAITNTVILVALIYESIVPASRKLLRSHLVGLKRSGPRRLP
jgi:hypothetical protein